MVATFAKTTIWLTRFLQWSFAVIIMAITAYMVDQFRDFGSHGPREVVVPLIFSILAIIFTSFSIVALYFINYPMQLLSAFLDFCLWVGYLTSAGLNRFDYHVNGNRNLLWQKLTAGRLSAGMSPHRSRNNGLVKLLAALIIIQLILFFFTMLLQAWVAQKYREESRLHPHGEKRFSRSTAASEPPPAP
ncbi:hypothetical protein BDZ91DRAFT_687180 [Kalaharituber pfeilii]|nr:hypothetical protein BDZ91DRAFT_687180 [Kalaharituber pfeilii]